MTRTAAVLVLSTLLTVNVVMHTMAQRGSVFQKVELLVDVHHELVSEYVEVPDEKKLIDAAARAMVASLGDPYTVYLSKEEMPEFTKQVEGTFSGIGAEIDIHENFLRITAPLEDSPAWKAGILAGDIVLEIEGKSTEGITTAEAIKRLVGEEGTPVKLKVRHLDGKVVEMNIIRAQIIVPTVKGWSRKGDNHWDYMLDPANKIGLVRVTQFTKDTAPKLKAALAELQAVGMKGLILDLRFDPGGLLDSAVQVCDMFMDGGKSIVSIRGRTQQERKYESKTDADDIKDLPLVVLVNEYSASASEIVSGALKDNGRAIVIGTRTYGKGSVQQVKGLEANNGTIQGAVKITNALYYLPSGRNIHRKEGEKLWGVDPNEGFYVPMTAEETTQMVKLSREINAKLPGAGELTPQWIAKERSDPQLAAALEAVIGNVKTGDWPRTGKNGGDILSQQAEIERLRKQSAEMTEKLEELNSKISKLEKGEAPTPEPKKNEEK